MFLSYFWYDGYFFIFYEHHWKFVYWKEFHSVCSFAFNFFRSFVMKLCRILLIWILWYLLQFFLPLMKIHSLIRTSFASLVRNHFFDRPACRCVVFFKLIFLFYMSLIFLIQLYFLNLSLNVVESLLIDIKFNRLARSKFNTYLMIKQCQWYYMYLDNLV